MQITEFFDPSDDAEIAKFDAVGDSAEGVIAAPPEWIDDKFRDGEKVLIVLLENEGRFTKLFLRRRQLSEVGRAVADVGERSLDQGGHLKFALVGQNDTGKKYPVKVWSAVYVPPEPMGTAEIGEARVEGEVA